jgi:heterodisulfide reductase subunit A-like polyferredoxin
MTKRIGFYICHCGTNIAGKVRTEEVTAFTRGLRNVAVARDYKFMCSDPGQEMIHKDIHEMALNRVVVASCSPRLHEKTFQSACERAGLNPYYFQMACVREHCSWVTEDPREATEKAKVLVAAAINRVNYHQSLTRREVSVHPDVMVVGAGIAGIQAALDVARAKRKVYLVECDASIGGHMAKFDKTFPTLDCAACILTPKTVSVAQNPNVELLTYSEVEEVSGYIGNFKAKIRRKTRLVDEKKCNGCGACWGACPARIVPRKRRIVIGDRAITVSATPVQAGAAPKEGVGALAQKLRADCRKRIHENPDAHACDLCGLCIRMCRDVVGAGVLGAEKGGEGEKRPKMIVAKNPEKCISCGACAQVCHTAHIRLEPEDGREIRHDELRLGPNTAIALPFMQAIPPVPVINRDNCIHFKTGGCTVCKDVCENQAIDFAATDTHREIIVGTIVMATGFKTFDARRLAAYGYGRLPNVVTALEFEQLNNASGPTGGRIQMANGETPKSVAIVHCVGSRDVNYHEYCSRVCCMYALKYGHLIKEKTGHDTKVFNFYIDMRCFGKGYEEFYRRLQEEGITFIRGRPGEITDQAMNPEEQGKLIIVSEDTLLGRRVRVPVDMAILCTAMEARKNTSEVARIFGINQGGDGFFLEEHPKLGPMSTATDGIFLAGACQGPKDIPDAVSHASGAAAQAMALASRGKVEISPTISWIDPDVCAGCQTCIGLCPYSAIEFDERRGVSVVNEAVCKGCGSCAGFCPSGAARVKHFTARQVFAEIEAMLEAM